MACNFQFTKVHFTSTAKIEDEYFWISNHALLFAHTLNQGFHIKNSATAATDFVTEETVAYDHNKDQVEIIQISITLDEPAPIYVKKARPFTTIEHFLLNCK